MFVGRFGSYAVVHQSLLRTHGRKLRVWLLVVDYEVSSSISDGHKPWAGV